jgi:acyl-coenzyme A thioesterase PaaI-like protein
MPLRPGDHGRVVGKLTHNRRNRIFEAEAELHTQAGELIATARAKYLPIKKAEQDEFISDLVGDRGMFASG